jgi:hypothetical protein
MADGDEAAVLPCRHRARTRAASSSRSESQDSDDSAAEGTSLSSSSRPGISSSGTAAGWVRHCHAAALAVGAKTDKLDPLRPKHWPHTRYASWLFAARLAVGWRPGTSRALSRAQRDPHHGLEEAGNM